MSPLPPALVLIAAIALPTSANAQALEGVPSGVRVHVGQGIQPAPGDRRRPRRDDIALYGYGFGSPEAWALYNNRSFAPDSYNDWWHDRPDRSFPRWVSQNNGCERVWWSGGGWRC